MRGNFEVYADLRLHFLPVVGGVLLAGAKNVNYSEFPWDP